MMESSVQENLHQILDRINSAANSVGRTAEQVRLVVVTKGHAIENVREAISAGATNLGENYVEESLPKIEVFRERSNLIWHMIGHVQSRKARPVCENFDWVQSIDGLRIATRIDRFAGELGKIVPVLIECNISGEDTKYGWTAWNELEWEDLAVEIEPILEMNNINVLGLMTMPPLFTDPERARPYFIRLRKLRDYLSVRFPKHDWNELSMGMSADFEVAIQEGATIVRIGTAILGPRT
jgi:pyridoxal phosphate enzyme (YggS family)